MAHELNCLQNISHLKLFKCFMIKNKNTTFQQRKMVKIFTYTKIKDMFARMRHYISLRILNRIQTFFQCSISFLTSKTCGSATFPRN